jgi:PEP-CTERM motif
MSKTAAKGLIRVLLTGVAFLVIAAPSFAGTIATFGQNGVGFVYSGALTGMPVRLMVGPGVFPCIFPSASCPVLIDQDLTFGDVGTTFVFNAATAPNFGQIADIMTANPGGAFSLTPLPATFSAQSIPFSVFTLLNGGGPGFSGVSIDELDISLKGLFVIPFPFDPVANPDGPTTLGQADLVFSVQGSTVPEPATLLTLAAGFATLAFRKRRAPGLSLRR